jgi:hypothetical protein
MNTMRIQTTIMVLDLDVRLGAWSRENRAGVYFV